VFQYCHKKKSVDKVTSDSFEGFFTKYYTTVTFRNFT